jgi:hypothetical protein
MGTSSLYPLIALVMGQQTLAGRKTLLYLSELLDVPPNLDAVFRSVISEANRANVSVYTIDARGLSTEEELAGARDALEEARRIGQTASQDQYSGAVSKDEVKLSETAESSLRASVEGVLRDLAQRTGGFTIANTNNFKPGAEKIAADIAGYYQLSYVPPPSPFDGRFRRIEVKVNRKDVVVQTRSGYFALPPGESNAVFPYEVPLLGALSVADPPREFELRAAALRFGALAGGVDHKIVVEVPIAELNMITTTVAPAQSGRYGCICRSSRSSRAMPATWSSASPRTTRSRAPPRRRRRSGPATSSSSVGSRFPRAATRSRSQARTGRRARSRRAARPSR